MNISEKIDKYLMNENEREDIRKAKELIKFLSRRHKNNQKKIRQDILDNIVNNEYSRISNNSITIIWDEFNKKFPS